jgi:hypothetical protein
VLKPRSGYVTEVWGRRFSAVRLSDPCQISSVRPFLIERLINNPTLVILAHPCRFGTIGTIQYHYYLILIDTDWNVPGWIIAAKLGRKGYRGDWSLMVSRDY